MARAYCEGDRVAVLLPDSRRWVAARVLLTKIDRVLVETSSWLGVVPSERFVRPIYVVHA